MKKILTLIILIFSIAIIHNNVFAEQINPNSNLQIKGEYKVFNTNNKKIIIYKKTTQEKITNLKNEILDIDKIYIDEQNSIAYSQLSDIIKNTKLDTVNNLKNISGNFEDIQNKFLRKIQNDQNLNSIMKIVLSVEVLESNLNKLNNFDYIIKNKSELNLQQTKSESLQILPSLKKLSWNEYSNYVSEITKMDNSNEIIKKINDIKNLSNFRIFWANIFMYLKIIGIIILIIVVVYFIFWKKYSW